MKVQFLFVILVCLASTACKKPSSSTVAPALQKAAWLIGNWENKTPKGLSVETWTDPGNGTAYEGKSYFISGKDTLFSETIRIEEKLGQLYYIPTVSNQNSGKPIVFILTSSTEKEMVFENPEHDFPQKITYTLSAPDSLTAIISGLRKGKESKEVFGMKKRS